MNTSDAKVKSDDEQVSITWNYFVAHDYTSLNVYNSVVHLERIRTTSMGNGSAKYLEAIREEE